MNFADSQRKTTPISLEVVFRDKDTKYHAWMSKISSGKCYINCGNEIGETGEIIGFDMKCPNGEWLSLLGKIGAIEYPKGFEMDLINLADHERKLLAEITDFGYTNLLDYERKVLAEIADTDALHLKEEKPRNKNEFQWREPVFRYKFKPNYSDIIDKYKPNNFGKKKKRVLIADDDSTTVRLLEAIVANQGFHPVIAKDGREAYKILQEDNDFVASILDMIMPFIDGMDLIHFMKKDKRLENIPIGIITAEQGSKVWNESISAGANAFLPKPLNAPQVQMMLTTLVNR